MIVPKPVRAKEDDVILKLKRNEWRRVSDASVRTANSGCKSLEVRNWVWTVAWRNDRCTKNVTSKAKNGPLWSAKHTLDSAKRIVGQETARLDKIRDKRTQNNGMIIRLCYSMCG